MKNTKANSPGELRRRVGAFFEARRSDAPELTNFLDEVCHESEVYIFGGMLRDIALRGAEAFGGDIDFVVCTSERPVVSEFISGRNPEHNRFGGNRYEIAGWELDTWFIEDTWALKAQCKKPSKAELLLDTTFFDWDAILFNYSTSEILCRDDYFDALGSNLLALNYELNTSPFGSFVRALRNIKSNQVRTDERLTRFLISGLRSVNFSKVNRYESTKFSDQLLTQDDVYDLCARAEDWHGQPAFSWHVR